MVRFGLVRFFKGFSRTQNRTIGSVQNGQVLVLKRSELRTGPKYSSSTATLRLMRRPAAMPPEALRSGRRSVSVVRVGDPVGRTCRASGTTSTCDYNSGGWTIMKKGMNGGGRVGGCDGRGSGSLVNRL